MSNLAFQLCGILLLAGAIQQAPYLEFNKAGAGFYGDGRELPEPAGLSSVRIGVLGPARTADGLHQRTAIQMALEEANQRGGYRSRVQSGAGASAGAMHDAGSAPQSIPFEMVFREDDGPWGVAAKQVVQLAYEDKVWAIIGGLDGLHTHVAELVVSKAWVPVISPSAVDSSISYANVPWVFRAAPADSRQADSLLAFAERKGYRHLVVLSEVDRESHTGFLRLSERAAQRHTPIDLHLEYSALNPEEVIGRILSTQMDAIIVWGKPEPALRLLLALRKSGITVPVLGCSDLATSEFEQNATQLENVIVSSLCDVSDTKPEVASFRDRFRRITGQAPSATAFYSYDVARLVIAAIERGGLNRARIRDRLTETSFAGVTGNISFNMLGGNDSEPVLMQLKRNHWARLE